jgi:hypothetical protein
MIFGMPRPCLVLARGLIGDSAGVDEACRNFDDERVLTPLWESADRAGLPVCTPGRNPWANCEHSDDDHSTVTVE